MISRNYLIIIGTILKFIFQMLKIVSVVLIIILLLPLVLPYIKGAYSFHYIQTAVKIEHSMNLFIKNTVPTKIAGFDITRWIGAISLLILAYIFASLKNKISRITAKSRFNADYEKMKSELNISGDPYLLNPLKEKIEKMHTDNKSEREELLKLFAETKKKLDSMGRDLAFLSIDVVDSTGLKENEEKGVIEHDFREYKKFVESRLIANGALKSTWTPDGVMSCFANVDHAVNAAKAIIEGLDTFNKEIKTIRKDFKVRCGINAGYVYFDESRPLEELSDRVIDIAGHLQKNAPPNTICIAKPAIEPLKERTNFVPTKKVVDGYEVYISERRKTPRE